jgi:hypothetical protein
VSKQLRLSINRRLADRLGAVCSILTIPTIEHIVRMIAGHDLNHAKQIERQSGASGCAGVLGITSQRQKLYRKQCPSQVDRLADLSNSHVLRKILDWLDSCSS